MKVRGDFEGVAHVRLSGGGVVVLAAGDTIPAGAIGVDHLSAKEAEGGSGIKRGRRSATRPAADT